MGYRIFVLETNFRASKENTEKMLATLKQLCVHQPTILLSGGKKSAKPVTRNFAFVDGKTVLKAKNIRDALSEWRWLPLMDEEGNVEELDFLGEKLGDERILFEAIAPYVEAGSDIVVAGEDGKVWRWRFDGKQCQREEGRIIF